MGQSNSHQSGKAEVDNDSISSEYANMTITIPKESKSINFDDSFGEAEDLLKNENVIIIKFVCKDSGYPELYKENGKNGFIKNFRTKGSKFKITTKSRSCFNLINPNSLWYDVVEYIDIKSIFCNVALVSRGFYQLTHSKNMFRRLKKIYIKRRSKFLMSLSPYFCNKKSKFFLDYLMNKHLPRKKKTSKSNCSNEVIVQTNQKKVKEKEFLLINLHDTVVLIFRSNQFSFDGKPEWMFKLSKITGKRIIEVKRFSRKNESTQESIYFHHFEKFYEKYH